eukprot:gnl/Spiro4/13700_TR7297_c0_g2_i1.p1 gnl/Spiro4/13700_TR7297_c0_g2~~gnl/Spiro4/13700_TR7297_c0_g2_i1.p1  ORF type:complete len:262 (-),score=89.52 gnl/Spiro4/13700_TR7297_c0_g2_i1:636-1421(-)
MATRADTNELVAMKVVEPRSSNMEDLRNELVVMRQVQHPNIVALYETFLWDERVWIVMEYMSLGSLFTVLKSRTFKEAHIAYVCSEVLTGLAYLHDNLVIHRDIKSDNILLDRSGNVKIADFGFCSKLERRGARRNSDVGTVFWMAPEVIRGDDYDFSVDLWSLGIVCIEMAQGLPPYYHESRQEAAQRIMSGASPELDDPSAWGRHFKSFLATCLNVNPRARGTASSLSKHPFLAQACRAQDLVALCSKARDAPDRQIPD